MLIYILPPDIIQIDGVCLTIDKRDFPHWPAAYPVSDGTIDHIVWDDHAPPTCQARGVMWLRLCNGDRETRYFHHISAMKPYIEAFERERVRRAEPQEVKRSA